MMMSKTDEMSDGDVREADGSGYTIQGRWGETEMYANERLGCGESEMATEVDDRGISSMNARGVEGACGRGDMIARIFRV